MDESKNYSVRAQDFIPFVGSFFYQRRNWLNNGLRKPFPYESYIITGAYLSVLDFLSGLALAGSIYYRYFLIRGLERFLIDNFVDWVTKNKIVVLENFGQNVI